MSERLGPVKTYYLAAGAAIGAVIGVLLVNQIIHVQRVAKGTGPAYKK